MRIYLRMSIVQLMIVIVVILMILMLIDGWRRIQRRRILAKNVVCKKEDQFVQTLKTNDSLTSSQPLQADIEAWVVGSKLSEQEENGRKEVQEEQEVDPWKNAQKESLQKRLGPKISTTLKMVQSSDMDSDIDSMTIVWHICAPRGYVFHEQDLIVLFEYLQISKDKERGAFVGYNHDNETLFQIIPEEGVFFKALGQESQEALEFETLKITMNLTALSNPKIAFKQVLSLMYQLAKQLNAVLLNSNRTRFTQSDVSQIMAKIKSIAN